MYILQVCLELPFLNSGASVISEELMVNHFLPGLRCLRTDMEQLSPEHEVLIKTFQKCFYVYMTLLQQPPIIPN